MATGRREETIEQAKRGLLFRAARIVVGRSSPSPASPCSCCRDRGWWSWPPGSSSWPRRALRRPATRPGEGPHPRRCRRQRLQTAALRGVGRQRGRRRGQPLVDLHPLITPPTGEPSRETVAGATTSRDVCLLGRKRRVERSWARPLHARFGVCVRGRWRPTRRGGWCRPRLQGRLRRPACGSTPTRTARRPGPHGQVALGVLPGGGGMTGGEHGQPLAVDVGAVHVHAGVEVGVLGRRRHGQHDDEELVDAVDGPVGGTSAACRRPARRRPGARPPRWPPVASRTRRSGRCR